MSNCPSGIPSGRQVVNNMPSIMEGLKGKLNTPCVTESDNVQAAATALGVTVAASATHGFSEGCGAIAVLSTAYSNITNLLGCTVNTLISKSEDSIEYVNNIKLSIDGAIVNKINLSQTIDGVISITTKLDEQAKNTLTADITDVLKQVSNNVQNIDQAFGNTTAGATSIQNMQTELNKNITNSSVADTVNEFLNNIDIKNDATVVIRNSKVDDLTIDQDIAVNIAIVNAASKIMEQLTDVKAVTDVLQEQINAQTSISRDAPNVLYGGLGSFLVGMVVLLILLGVGGWFVYKNKDGEGEVNTYPLNNFNKRRRK